jgi:hypothetical protein
LFDCAPTILSNGGLVGQDDAVGNAAAKLNAAIAALIHAEVLKFHLSETSRFQYVIRLAKFAPPDYEPPKCKLIGGGLLNLNQDEYIHHTMERISLKQDDFGLSLMGDEATVKRMPMVNLLCYGVHDPAGCLEIADCTRHFE